jgi:hypothetical protein
VSARTSASKGARTFKPMPNIETGCVVRKRLDTGRETLISTGSLRHLYSKTPVDARVLCFARLEKTTSQD